MTDHTARAVELTEQALDHDQGVMIRHVSVAAAQVHAILALAEATGSQVVKLTGRQSAVDPRPAAEPTHTAAHADRSLVSAINEGYDEAQRQGIGGEETRDWLLGKIDHVLRAHDIYDDDGAADIASDIADAVLTEAPLSDGPALTTVAAAVTEAYTPEGQATWWRSWARNPDRRAKAEAGVLAVWSGHEDDLSASGAGLGGTNREQIAQVAQEVIDKWIEQGYQIACAGVGSVGDEPAMRKGFNQMRWLHLAEPWLPAYKVADAVLALRPDPAPDDTTDLRAEVEQWGWCEDIDADPTPTHVTPCATRDQAQRAVAIDPHARVLVRRQAIATEWQEVQP